MFQLRVLIGSALSQLKSASLFAPEATFLARFLAVHPVPGDP
jgi:hypothetical protein